MLPIATVAAVLAWEAYLQSAAAAAAVLAVAVAVVDGIHEAEAMRHLPCVR